MLRLMPFLELLMFEQEMILTHVALCKVSKERHTNTHTHSHNAYIHSEVAKKKGRNSQILFRQCQDFHSVRLKCRNSNIICTFGKPNISVSGGEDSWLVESFQHNAIYFDYQICVTNCHQVCYSGIVQSISGHELFWICKRRLQVIDRLYT